MLRGRRWVADYEEGLQKVYYKEDIVACIYAMTDWFTPRTALLRVDRDDGQHGISDLMHDTAPKVHAVLAEFSVD